MKLSSMMRCNLQNETFLGMLRLHGFHTRENVMCKCRFRPTYGAHYSYMPES